MAGDVVETDGGLAIWQSGWRHRCWHTS
jgi:hypothetical protein